MRKSWAAVTVGILFVAGVVVVYMLFRWISEGIGKGEGYTVWAHFGDATGLTPKTRAVASGIQIGQIEDISLDQDAQKAKVTIRVHPGIKIWSSAWLYKKTASLLGEYYLEIDPGQQVTVRNAQRKEHRELGNNEQITNVFEGTTPSDIMNQVSAIMPTLRLILEDVRALTSGQVKEIADNVNNMIQTNSVTLERLINRVDNIAASIEGITAAEADNIKVSIQNVRDITEGIKGLVGKSEGEVTKTGEDIRSSVHKLQTSVDRLDRSLANIEKITGKIADGEGTIGKLVSDPSIAENVDSISEDAATFVRGITRLQTIVGLRSEYNWLAGTFKSYFQVQLAPRPDKFYLIEIVDDPRGFRQQSTKITESSERGTVSETTVETSEKLRVSFMFGKCIGVFCGRFGIKESTGGVGLDVRLFDDRLVLSTDVFDSHSNQYPRLTSRANIAVYKRYLYLVAGIDDVFNYTRTRGGSGGFFDWFFGGQLQFNDEDLKQFLLVGGGSAAGAAR